MKQSNSYLSIYNTILAISVSRIKLGATSTIGGVCRLYKACTKLP